MSSVLGYERKIQAILDGNWKRFREFAAEEKAIDMDYWATYFAYDIVSELALGTPCISCKLMKGKALGMIQVGGDVNKVMQSLLFCVEYGTFPVSKIGGLRILLLNGYWRLSGRMRCVGRICLETG